MIKNYVKKNCIPIIFEIFFIISCFLVPKEYIIYTKNERDDKGLITVYISNVDRSSGSTKLYGVDDENEWNRIKDVLRELSKSEQ